MGWKTKLTFAEEWHLRNVAGVKDLEGLKRMAANHAEMRRADLTVYGRATYEPCWICRGICCKLGLEV
jgi:hypothetical protein